MWYHLKEFRRKAYTNKKDFWETIYQARYHGSKESKTTADDDESIVISAPYRFTYSTSATGTDLSHLSDATSQLSDQLYAKYAKNASLRKQNPQLNQQMTHTEYAEGSPKPPPQLHTETTPPVHHQ